MSNWFEDNASKSIIGYTIIIAGTTWAISTFVLQENRINYVRSELEAQKSLTEQYKSKSELLQRDIDVIRAENIEYRSWLSQSKDALPMIVPRIVELKQQISSLQSQITSSDTGVAASSATLKAEGTAKLGTAFIDAGTGLIVTVLGTTPDRTAKVIVKFPEDKPIEASISPGAQWNFSYRGNKLVLTVKSVNFAGDYIDLIIEPAK